MNSNLLYYGDNLDVLRRHVKDESVDLIYLHPHFKSNQHCAPSAKMGQIRSIK
jgi:hypothetical protein